MKQNTKDWKKWRLGGIGASDSNVIMKATDKKTPLELYHEKLGGPEKKVPEFIVNKGHKFEEIARAHVELMTMLDFPPKLIEHKDHPFMLASLDGYCEETNQNWECKFAGKEKFEQVKAGKVIDEFYPQLQHQMFVSGAKECILQVVWEDKEKELHHTTTIVKPDMDYMAKLFIECEKFWKCVQDKTPPKIDKKDVVKVKDGEVKKAITKYCKLDLKAKGLKKEMADLKTVIFKELPHTNMDHNGVKVQIIESSGSLDYKFAYKYILETLGNIGSTSTGPEDYENLVMDMLKKHSIDNFRKAGSTQQKITPIKVKKEEKAKKDPKKEKKDVKIETEKAKVGPNTVNDVPS